METESRSVLVPLAEGFEEVEAVAVIDVLRRAGIEVLVAARAIGPVQGAHGIALQAEHELGVLDPEGLDGIVLPGGMPGTLGLVDDPRVLELVRLLHGSGRLVGAICAAPMVLAAAGIDAGRTVTSHPSVRDRLGAATVVDAPRVVVDGNLITSQGPGTALEFSLALVECLVGRELAEKLRAAMLIAEEEAPPR